ncbi:MAG TPA: complex I subunit 1 family protein [Anaeromyxobacter sp.]|nr:complex I subunit 1 family protein [Anaeromyxobacter sp.]
MTLSSALLRLLVFPGLVYAVPAAWFFLWVERKAVARMQQRIGPPLLQPFYDFMKLLGKRAPPRPGLEGALTRAWPVLAAASAAGAVGLLPVLPGAGGFAGDLVLLLALLELPAIFLIAAGFSSRSLYGQIGSAREAVMGISYNLVFLSAVLAIALAQHTFRLDGLAQPSASPLRWLGVAAILLCLPAKLHVTPFSLPNAEQEIYAGALTEYAGPELALWELAHGLEWVAMTGLVAALVVPPLGPGPVQGLIFVAVSALVVLGLSALAAATARVTIERATRFYWRAALVVVVVGAGASLLMGFAR